MHALAISFDEGQEPWIASILDVINAKPAVVVTFPFRTVTAFELGIDEHQVANDARLMRVRKWMIRFECANDLGLLRIGDVKDGRTVRPVLVAYIGEFAVQDDLSAAVEFHTAQMSNIR